MSAPVSAAPESIRASNDSLNESDDDIDFALFSSSATSERDLLAEAKQIFAARKENLVNLEKQFELVCKQTIEENAKYAAEIQLKDEQIRRAVNEMHHIAQVNAADTKNLEKKFQTLAELSIAKDVFLQKMSQESKINSMKIERFIASHYVDGIVQQEAETVYVSDSEQVEEEETPIAKVEQNPVDDTQDDGGEKETTVEESFIDAQENVGQENQAANDETLVNKENVAPKAAIDPLDENQAVEAEEEPEVVVQKSFVCQFCGEKFAKKKDLREHKVVDHKIKLPQLKKKMVKRIKRKRDSTDEDEEYDYDYDDENDAERAYYVVQPKLMPASNVLRVQGQFKKGKKMRKLVMYSPT